MLMYLGTEVVFFYLFTLANSESLVERQMINVMT